MIGSFRSTLFLLLCTYMTTTPFLIFDFDGTLSDTLSIFIDAYNEAAPKFHLRIISKSERLTMQDLAIGQVIRTLKIHPFKLLPLIWELKRIMQREQDRMRLFPDMKEALLLAHKSGIQMGILSSNRVSIIRYVMKKTGTEDLFHFILSEKNFIGKKRYLTFLRKKYADQQIWYVGDQVSDIEACHGAKVRSIAVPWGFNTADSLQVAKPDFLVDSPRQIIEIVQNQMPEKQARD